VRWICEVNKAITHRLLSLEKVILVPAVIGISNSNLVFFCSTS
jgi:hypothetical protein